MNSINQIIPGMEVIARDLRWEILHSENMGEQTRFRLRGLESAILGHEIDILHPFETIDPLRKEIQPEKAAPLMNWLVYHQAFLLEQAFGPDAMLAVQPGRLRMEPYQLVPVIRAIKMSRVRMLLADGVGLGKTIQAGLIITELIARRLAHRVLFVTPAGPLLEQWKIEMNERFGLRIDTIDRVKLESLRRGTELGSNPFDHIPLGIVSIDFLKQESVMERMERSSYDIIVIDEAHHCTDAGSAGDRDSSQRRKLAEVLASRCDSLLLLTATPHDGNDRSFASLCELLDPSLVDGKGALRGERFRKHVVRRLKKHITKPDPDNPGKNKPLFPERIVYPIDVIPGENHRDFIELQKELIGLIAPELKRAFRSRNYSDVLAWLALLKRSVSTASACYNTLKVVRDRFNYFLEDSRQLQEMRRQRITTLKEYEKKLQRYGTITAEEEEERSSLEAEDIAQQLASIQREVKRGAYRNAKIEDVVGQLDRLIDLSGKARSADPKIERLIDIIKSIRKEEPAANILIYTEYIDSLNVIEDALIRGKLGTVLTISGDGRNREGSDEKRRASVIEMFRTGDNLILVSTDSAAEGLNLHRRCHNLIHFELPYNPNRLEQRNGRIDRYGQNKTPVVRYLYLKGTFEERILLRLLSKYERQRNRLTFVPNTFGINIAGDADQARLLQGLMDEEEKLFKDEPVIFDLATDEGSENLGADSATMELLEEIDRSLKGFRDAARTHLWLGDQGLNADDSTVREAEDARRRGSESGLIDLTSFVCDALRLDGGSVSGSPTDGVFNVSPPPQWFFGLDDIPGYDPEERLVRLTKDIDIMYDANEKQVGFVGRAHPLVRRALDRVRNHAFGGLKTGQDIRASVVRWNSPDYGLLCTFLARITSAEGRELEEVIAVSLTKDGKVEYCDKPEEWLKIADITKSIKITDIWKKHYSDWGSEVITRAGDAARNGFAPRADLFIKERVELLKDERNNISTWLKKRAEDLTGKYREAPVRMGDLFNQSATAPDDKKRPDWMEIDDPTTRLKGFIADRSQPHYRRAEADNLLTLYTTRNNHIDARADLREPDIIPLGVLMLVPEDRHGA